MFCVCACVDRVFMCKCATCLCCVYIKVHVHLCATRIALACETLWVHNAVSVGVCDVTKMAA